MPTISIITTVYDAKEYLPATVASILAQTFADFELILVDDGSPNGCGVLCDALAAQDGRIRVLHKPNGGPASASNAGLNAARGLVYHAAWLMDNGQPADKAASMAKYYSAEAAIEIVNKSLQLHGGYGYSREYEIERIYRDVRVCSIYEGSSQVQQMVISGQLLK